VRITAEQKSQWLRQSGLSDIFDQPNCREFYERLTNTPLQIGSIFVASLRVGDEVAATMWGAIFRTRFCFLLTSYQTEWTRYSVGRLLMESVVQWCIAQKTISTFDLTVGDEAYKRHWADHSLAVYEHLAARSMKGALIVTYRRARNRLRDNRATRAFVRRVLTGFRARPQFSERSCDDPADQELTELQASAPADPPSVPEPYEPATPADPDPGTNPDPEPDPSPGESRDQRVPAAVNQSPRP